MESPGPISASYGRFEAVVVPSVSEEIVRESNDFQRGEKRWSPGCSFPPSRPALHYRDIFSTSRTSQ